MPAQIKSDLQRTLDRAVQMSRNAIIGTSGGNGSGFGAALPLSGTRASVDGDGNVVTLHAFMIGVDKIGDASAHLERGLIHVLGFTTLYRWRNA